MLRLQPAALALCTLLTALPVAHAGGASATMNARAMRPLLDTDQLIAVLSAKATVPLSQALDTAVLARHGVAVRSIKGRRVRLDKALPMIEATQLANELRAANALLTKAWADGRGTVAWVPNDPMWGQLWSYWDPTAGINLPPALNYTRGKGIVVAVVDTGYSAHSELLPNLALPGYNMVLSEGRKADGLAWDGGCGFHGSHVAGTIAAVGNNGAGMSGVAPEAKVLPVRALYGCYAYWSDVADAVTWASGGSVSGTTANPTPARVINMSLQGYQACSPDMQAAITGARARGTVVVVAAGNAGLDASNSMPANCTGVIAVAAVDGGAQRANFSNYGPLITVSAPGVNILSTIDVDGYAVYSGTSMASPHVAGVVALMLSMEPWMSPDQVAAELRRTAKPLSCTDCGAGLVDAFRATPPQIGRAHV
jgi:serine protease